MSEEAGSATMDSIPNRQVPPDFPAIEKGNFSLILHRVGMRKVSVVVTVFELHGKKSLADAKSLVEGAPVVVLSRIAEASAEAAAKLFEKHEAAVFVRRSAFGEKVGDSVLDVHPAGPEFELGSWRLVLIKASEPEIYTILALTQLIPDLRPSVVKSLVEQPGQNVIERVDRKTAQRMADVLEAAGAEVRIEVQLS